MTVVSKRHTPQLWFLLLEDIEQRCYPDPTTTIASVEYAALVAAMEHDRPACSGDPRFTTDDPDPVLHAICDTCPIRTECAAYARLAEPTAGFWPSQPEGRTDEPPRARSAPTKLRRHG